MAKSKWKFFSVQFRQPLQNRLTGFIRCIAIINIDKTQVLTTTNKQQRTRNISRYIFKCFRPWCLFNTFCALFVLLCISYSLSRFRERCVCFAYFGGISEDKLCGSWELASQNQYKRVDCEYAREIFSAKKKNIVHPSITLSYHCNRNTYFLLLMGFFAFSSSFWLPLKWHRTLQQKENNLYTRKNASAEKKEK